jgi:hypothetical protein
MIRKPKPRPFKDHSGKVHGDLRITTMERYGSRILWNAECTKCGSAYQRARKIEDIRRYAKCPACTVRGKKVMNHPWLSDETAQQIDRVYRFFVQMRPMT